MEDRILPHNLDAEVELLSAAFCPDGMDKIKGLISAEDFYSESGKLIFGKMVEFYESGRGFTISTMDQVFEEHPEHINIRRALYALRPFTAETATYFSRIVKELADRRRAIKAIHQAHENLFDLSKPIGQIMDILRVELLSLTKVGLS